jgi:hypothetical protein
MEPVVLIVLIIGIVVVLSGGSPAPVTPSITVIQQPSYESTRNGVGCLPLIVIAVLVLILLGVVQGL